MLLPQNNREEKSSRHVAMVARVLDDDKPIKSLKSVFALFQASPILFNFVWFGKSWRNFLWDRIYRYLSLEKESDNFCVVFTYSIKWAREIRKFRVVVVQRWQRNVENSMIRVQVVVSKYKHLIFLPFFLPSPSSLVLLSSRNSATMVTWRHTSPLYPVRV